ncbi:MAG TPA: fluoride efflux transporter CrcB [Methylococcaceae bacterium]|jgi:CrcB protein|nr:fluoride efflux transporter CrcB [Methylococcaceae bacterium]HIN69263.1 fluoride efflux transporter CrcB [Methylococcales bacterium]HIA44507.1 fluoride efflux transporter CrcB [Methylococcaceae bacterium]HIB62005.1 fluoride efflux transporter CrcB [Methylococcaceae bacterium]HIO12625.1 fluoride efflux transporter CrcB [Methylococcales bacterium]
MSQLYAVAFGGALGAVLRFLISTGVYQWLGRGFPYGTLAVNIIGSFLIGLMTEALVVQRVAFGDEYRLAILVGVFGSLTTFSTFSLDTLYLLEQGHLTKAMLNIFVSVSICVLVVWLGLSMGRLIFQQSSGVYHGANWALPYGLLITNSIGAFLLGMITGTLMHKVVLTVEYQTVVVVLLGGLFITLSSLYIMLHMIEEGFSFDENFNLVVSLLLGNVVLTGSMLSLGLLAGKQM